MEEDFVEKIHVAQFWRKQLGEMEYVYQNPDDLRRWYIALENRGPDDIRSYLTERTGRFPPTVLTGIVATAPHPPVKIVELWLKSHDKVNTTPFWAGGSAFLLFTVLVATNLQSCMNIKNPNMLQTNPPNLTPPLLASQAVGAPPATSTPPAQLTPPASLASPPTGMLPGAQ
jgi:hypothetical protein